MFLNETQHPKAHSLFNHLMLCGARVENGDPDFYVPLETWRESQGYTDEKVADLYARIAEAFDGTFFKMPRVAAETKLSRHLWSNDKEFPHV